MKGIDDSTHKILKKAIHWRKMRTLLLLVFANIVVNMTVFPKKEVNQT